MALDIVCHEYDSTIRCTLDGELDLASQEEALAELIGAVEKSPETVVIDLSRVAFIDSTGLRVLISCHQHADEKGTRVLLASPSEAVQRLLEITRMETRFEYFQGG